MIHRCFLSVRQVPTSGLDIAGMDIGWRGRCIFYSSFDGRSCLSNIKLQYVAAKYLPPQIFNRRSRPVEGRMANTQTAVVNLNSDFVDESSEQIDDGQLRIHSPSGSEYIMSPSKSVVKESLLKPTHSFLSLQKEVQESRGRIKPEKDIWWEKRGCKWDVKVNNKALAHVTSKLMSPTAATTFSSREKAVIEKQTVKPLPRRSGFSPSNPHAHVKSKLYEPTKATKAGAWKKRETGPSSPEDLGERSTATVSSSHSVVGYKVRETSSRLLAAPAHTQTSKFQKAEDPREKGWKPYIPPKTCPLDKISPLPAIAPMWGNSDYYYSNDDNISAISNDDMEGHRCVPKSSSQIRPRSAPIAARIAGRQAYVNESPVRLSSASLAGGSVGASTVGSTPKGFGSGTPRATTPSGARRSGSAPTTSRYRNLADLSGGMAVVGLDQIESY